MPYEVKDNKTGNVITFQNEPTESDIREAFGVSEGEDATASMAGPSPLKQNVSQGIRNFLSWGGGALGGIAGAGVASPVLAGAGYAGGQSLADLVDTHLLGINRQQPLAEDLSRTAGRIGEGAIAEVGGQIAGKALGAAYQYAKKPITQATQKIVRWGMNKGVRPSVANTRTATQSNQYYAKAKNAVEAIVKNRANLQFADDEGNMVAGQLPKNLREFSEAIEQTKKTVFQQYDDLAVKAGKQGRWVDLEPIAKELDTIGNHRVLKDVNPRAADHARLWAERMRSHGGYTLKEAQDVVAAMNQKLNAFYRNPSYDTASRAYVDSLITNNLRKSLDDVITRSQGPGYQELRNTYGALKAIEKDVNSRATVDARRNVKGLLDFSDILTSGQVVYGALHTNPALVASGVTGKVFSSIYKRMNDPSRIISKMFDDVDGVLSGRIAPNMINKLRPVQSLPFYMMREGYQTFPSEEEE